MKHLLVLAAGALAACQSQPAADNQAEAAAPETNRVAAPETDAQAAERLVRGRAAAAAEGAEAAGPLSFGPARTGTHEGVSVVCGTFTRDGREQRYIVVNRDDVFIESEMRAGQMAEAVAEFCGDGERG